MRAVTQANFGGPEELKVDLIDEPIAAAGQVLVKVIATSVNRPDVIQRQGNYPPPPGDSDVLGLEIAGEVAEVGAGVSRWKVGDRVMGLVGGGGYAEFATAWEHHLMAVPETLSWAQAASVSETYITAHLNLFQYPGLSDGQSVLLHGGGGGVNIAAIQLCQALVPGSALFVTCSTAKVARVKALGDVHVIDYKNEDFAKILKEATKGQGVDLILDHIGAAYLERNLKSLSIGGSLVLIGVMGGAKSEINLAQLMVRRQKICGSVLRPRPVEEKASIIQYFYQQALPHFLNGNLSPIVDRIFLLEDVRKAHELMDASGHFGKIVLQVDASISIV
ncbi:NAD(P)H-quinone oxidoreductase [Arenicellales bacterium nBUS_48]|nr:NAD(P)H-quinone oxidoreductase [Pseudomonadota bacterium]